MDIVIILGIIIIIVTFVLYKILRKPKIIYHKEFPADFPDAEWTNKDDLKGINKHYK